jgi:hypothetical protein
MAETLEDLETERAAQLRALSETGDMRQGSITESYRPCGKSNCACADPKHPGHGPFYALTRKVGGKTQTIQLRPGPELSKLLREVDTYHRFRRGIEDLSPEMKQEIIDRTLHSSPAHLCSAPGA